MRQIGSGALELDADIRKTARGDHSAFGRIVEAYQGRIFAYLGRMGLDSTTAEDIAQDTFLRMWRNAGQFDPKLGGLTTWILTIARNLALTHLSRPVRHSNSGVPRNLPRWRRTCRNQTSTFSPSSAGSGCMPP
jgi:RNA polymerase sigma factor (sigma-70 family)